MGKGKSLSDQFGREIETMYTELEAAIKKHGVPDVEGYSTLREYYDANWDYEWILSAIADSISYSMPGKGFEDMAARFADVYEEYDGLEPVKYIKPGVYRR